ncbi:MAG: 4Fe-4S binding protein [Candidatus Zixiibacteriota bacterium]|nr:MAG: 4Fe-4S binding protein [candidate division Zixibacteria bacterium]
MLEIDQDACLDCGGCVPLCPEEALFLSFNRLECDHNACTMCLICIQFCPVGALGESRAVEV